MQISTKIVADINDCISDKRKRRPKSDPLTIDF